MPPVRSTPLPTRTPAGTRRKTTLFCPECGHESHLEGDWRRRDGGELVCPSCGAVVERR